MTDDPTADAAPAVGAGASDAGPVVVVTDSTATVPTATCAELGIVVVPLYVVVGDRSWPEGADAGALAAALADGSAVTTAQPTPEDLAAAYRSAAAAGARRMVSVHLSSHLSGTAEAASVAAARSPVPVHVVDSATTAMAMGFAVVAGARLAAAGGTATEVLGLVEATLAGTSAYFLVDDLDRLRRGGRLSTAQAAVATALGVRPVLTVSGGEVVVAERVRGRRRGLQRLVELAVRDAAGRRVQVAVQHLGAPEEASALAGELSGALGVGVAVSEASAVIGAHTGLGLLAVMVAPVPGS